MNRLNGHGEGIASDKFVDTPPLGYKRTNAVAKFTLKTDDEWVIAQRWIKRGEPDFWVTIPEYSLS